MGFRFILVLDELQGVDECERGEKAWDGKTHKLVLVDKLRLDQISNNYVKFMKEYVDPRV
jgi:hypothetical protein